MDVEKVIKTRRSIRKFLSVPVEKEKIMKIIEAGSYAPCSGNIENWRFVIVQDKTKIQEIASACIEQTWISTAPVVIAVCSEMKEITQHFGLRAEMLYSIQNCAAAIQNMLLEVTNLGLGSCWVGAFEEESIKRILEIPKDVRVQALLPIGYPDEKPPMPMKLKLYEITFIEAYGNRITDLSKFLKDTHYLEKAIDKAKSLFR